jgi:O-acetyl-ADP-ribose deacetylase (regulator of RNase III)
MQREVIGLTKKEIVVKQGDITKFPVDAIVNAANQTLAMGSGVCGAIFKAAGIKSLQNWCNTYTGNNGPTKPGECTISPPFNLPAKHIVHAVGPIYDRYSPAEALVLLDATYSNSLQEIEKLQLQSISFPAISTGVYGYPKQDAAKIAVQAINRFLKSSKFVRKVYLFAFDDETFNYLNEAHKEYVSEQQSIFQKIRQLFYTKTLFNS